MTVPLVLLNANGLKVSQPGVDVTTATPAQMNFDSDYAGLGMILQGWISPPWSGSSNAFWNQSVSLGQTFSTPPIVAFDMNWDNVHYAPMGPSGFYFELDQAGSYFNVLCEATTSTLEFQGTYFISPGGAPVPNFNIRYTVFAINH